jgi:uncharacterized protein YqhQ
MAEPKIKDALSEKDVKQTSIGGQAVMEGVMMRGKRMYAMAVRKPDKTIELVKTPLTPLTEKYPLFKLPILRGILAFIDSMVTGVRIITKSAEIAGLEDVEEEELSKFEIKLQKMFGEKLNDIILGIVVVIAVAIAVGLFMVLPTFLGSLFSPLLGDNTWPLGIIEGFLRIAIFVAYVYLVSMSKDIKRLYQYHGAEHKTISCLEHQEELTVENVQKHSRLHKRCGTSFLLIVMVIAMLVFLFVRTNDPVIRILSRVILVPFIAGLSYEIIKWAGRNDNWFVNMISYPGMCMQKITTAEPEPEMIEVAITAMNAVIESEPQAC